MGENDESNTPVKEVIFNEDKYPVIKKIIVILFILLLSWSQLINNDTFILTLVFIGNITGISYFIGKLYFYNTSRKIKDIIFLIIFIGLLFWGIYAFYTL